MQHDATKQPTPNRSNPFMGAGAWDNLDHALRQLNRANDMAIELQPKIRELETDGEWCAERLGFCNGAMADYIAAAREALEALRASACGKVDAEKGGTQ